MASPFRSLIDGVLPWLKPRPVSNGAIMAANGAPPMPQPAPTPETAGPHEVVHPLVEGQEFGAAGTENFGGYIRREDYNPELDNFVTAVRVYDKMRLGDAQIRAMLSVIKLPLRGATWVCLPPESGDAVDQAIADYCNHCLFEDDAMEFSWDYTLRHILLQLDFGFSVLEKVWKVDEDGHFRLLRLAPRLPKTIRMWHVDRNGRLLAVIQYAPVPISTTYPGTGKLVGSARDLPMLTRGGDNPQTAAVRYGTSVSFQYLTIPAEYCSVFTLEREGDNYQGHSILRSVYRNFYFKDQAYHLEGVRLDRWGVGIPVAYLEEGHTLNQQDLDSLVEVLKAVKSNERAYLIAPPHVRYALMPESGSQSAGSGAAPWIDHHDAQIARNVLAGFLTMGTDQHGTLGFGARLTDMFVSSLNGVAQGICSDLKRQVVKQLCDLNFDMTKRKYPRVTCRDLEQVDLSHIVETLATLQQVWITPDDNTEKLLRKLLDLPPLDESNTRKALQEEAAKASAAKGVPPGEEPKGAQPIPPRPVPGDANVAAGGQPLVPGGASASASQLKADKPRLRPRGNWI